jgi:hypothetical protein
MITRKLGERDLTLPTLYILYTKGKLSTSELKDEIISLLNPGGENLDPLVNRPDTKITQIIRNIISHKETTTNIIFKGLINYSEFTGILSITEKGVTYLNKYISSKLIQDIA